jgi:hypothetical protein
MTSAVAAQQADVCGGITLADASMTGDIDLLPRIQDAGFRNEMMAIYPIKPSDWDEGWGWGDPTNLNLPLARLFTALWIFHHVAEIDDFSNILGWGDDYTVEQTPQLTPSCSDEYGARASDYVVASTTRIGKFFFDGDVMYRSSTFIHEARHHEGFSHDAADDACDRGGSCDVRLFDWGANGFEVSWLSWASSRGQNMTPQFREWAVAEANSVLESAFEEEPGFRVYPPGGAVGGATLRTEFTWASSGEEDTGIAVLMTPRNSTACFLTKVTGQFEGGGEFFDVVEENGSWTITGNSEREDADATLVVQSRCTEVSQAPELFFLQLAEDEENKSIDIGSSVDRVCYLAGAGGDFEGGAERARVFVSGDRWRLELSSLQTDAEERLRRRGIFPAPRLCDRRYRGAIPRPRRISGRFASRRA